MRYSKCVVLGIPALYRVKKEPGLYRCWVYAIPKGEPNEVDILGYAESNSRKQSISDAIAMSETELAGREVSIED